MSQQISRPVGDGTSESKQTAQSSRARARWMGHWMGNSTSTERRNHSPCPQQEELDRISENGNLANIEPNDFEAVNDDRVIRSPKSFDKAIDGSKVPAALNELSLRGFRFFGEDPLNSQHIVPYNNNNNNSVEKYEPGKGKAAATSINDAFGRHWFQKTKGVRFLSAQTEDDKLNSNKSQFDLETMRMCTTVDSVQAVPGGCPRFSQTTHILLITKKTDANQENDVYRGGARFDKRTNENASRDLSPFFRQGNRGVKIQPLSSLSNSQRRNNVESSAETDTMEMDFCKEEKLNYGANSTPSTKALNINSNPPPPIGFAPSRQIEHRWINSRLPNTTNLELPALPAVKSPPENVCPSSSKTQSLEMDMLLDNAEHHARTKPNPNPEDPDPSSPWVKRLKMSSSSQGTKISSNPSEYLSHDKMRRYFKSILDSSVTDSYPSPRNKDHCKETIVSDKKRDLSKEGEGFIMDIIKKNDKESSSSSLSLLSHVWIKRWLRNGPKVAEQKPDQAVEKRVRGPLDDDDELEKKQFPSIGAMAMMGKAMAGFHSCEFQKRGSFTVWNSKEAF